MRVRTNIFPSGMHGNTLHKPANHNRVLIRLSIGVQLVGIVKAGDLVGGPIAPIDRKVVDELAAVAVELTQR